MTDEEKLAVLDEVMGALGVPEQDLARLPDIARDMARRALTPPVLLAVAMDPATGALKQYALSQIPQTPENMARLSRMAAGLSHQFQDAALAAIPSEKDK